MKNTCLCKIGIALLAVLMLAAITTACNSDNPVETTAEITVAATETPTEVPTEAPTETPTEPVTEPETETEEDTRWYREDYEKDDPSNPFYNLIPAGISLDGKTTAYDARYDFYEPICHINGDIQFSSIQEALDWLEGEGGIVTIDRDPNVCLKVKVPNDGCFYRIGFMWFNVDIVADFGCIYDDQTAKNGVMGYCYYSDLARLDAIAGLENTCVWILGECYGLAPGYYRMKLSEKTDSEMRYEYELISPLSAWPGLPKGEILPTE